jgi:hypothetical protein
MRQILDALLGPVSLIYVDARVRVSDRFGRSWGHDVSVAMRGSLKLRKASKAAYSSTFKVEEFAAARSPRKAATDNMDLHGFCPDPR